ncbi:MAG: LPS assembly lipoprotein LptE [Spirochaetia bacterium]|nr:LPS assembly lipoprotein LptE [Spirochaetia bacterium]
MNYIIKIIFAFLLLSSAFCSTPQSKDDKKEDIISKNPLEFIDGEEIITQNYKTIYVYNFANSTYHAHLTERLKEKIRNELNLDGRLKVIDNKKEADLLLLGNIEQYKHIPSYFDNFGQPKRFLMTIQTRIWVRINPKIDNAMLLEKRYVRYDTSYSILDSAHETEYTAIERLLDTLAQRITLTVFEGWHTRLKTDKELGYEASKENQGFFEIEDAEKIVPKDLPKEKRDKMIEELTK